MQKKARSGLIGSGLVLLALLLLPSISQGDAGNQYCVTPAFVSGNIPPNLLLMIDNSASMYDLAFVDQGKKHCSVDVGNTCVIDSDCPTRTPAQTCSAFDRQPYYCYDQTYSNSTTYAGYFETKDDANTDIFYAYNSGTRSFVKTSTAFPAGCNVNGTTTTSGRSIANTLCVEYANDNKSLTSFVAKGNYLNWLTASKFDVEKQIFTGGKYVTKVCNNVTGNPDVACASDADCGSVSGACTAVSSFVQTESRGCVGQGFIKDALTGNFVNYNSPVTNNPNTQLGVTFSVHGPLNTITPTTPSTGGQTFIDLFPVGKAYDFGACQKAVSTLQNTSATNSDVKKDVAACLAGAAGGTCQNPTSNLANCKVATSSGSYCSCFATNPDCDAPTTKVCSLNRSKTCTIDSNCASGEGTCVTAYYCEGSGGGITSTVCTTPGVSSQCPSAAYFCDEGNTSVSGYTSPNALTKTCTTTGTECAPTYWCDWGAEWMTSSGGNTAAVQDCTSTGSTTCGYVCSALSANDSACHVSNTKNGQCSAVGSTRACNADSDCSSHNEGVCLGYKAQGNHGCIQHTPSHGTCRLINGSTNGVCGATQSYGNCVFGTSDISTKVKVNFQQTMQACWQYNRYVNHVSGGADIGTDDLKTLDNQCSSIYNGGASNSLPYKTCSNNHNKTCCQVSGTCSAATVTADCGAGTCTDGPNAIAPGNPALICSNDYAGKLYYKTSTGQWVKEGSLNDKTTLLKDVVLSDMGSPVTITIPSACSDTNYTFPGCLTKIHQAFCQANTAPNVADPTDAPSDSATYDNLPSILSGIGVESQLGAPIATMPVRVTPMSCSTDADCPRHDSIIGNRCSGGICKPTGLIQEFGSQIRIGAMSFNKFGSATETTAGYTATPSGATQGVKTSKVCHNDTTKSCTADTDCVTGVCEAATAGSTNLDGARVIYPIGRGKCASLTTTACASDTVCGSGAACYNGFCATKGSTVCTTAINNCTSGQVCVRDSVGDHSSPNTLIQTIDGIQAYAWTPFAEGFYNALGYFAAIPQSNGKFLSRVDGASTNSAITGLRLNGTTASHPADFDETLNPSEYRCQQNHILLVTDGSSTADRNPLVSKLTTTPATDADAGLGPRYAAASGTSSLYCPTVPPVNVDYGGTSNLPILSWLGRRQNLATFLTSAVTPVHCSLHTATTCKLDSDCPSGETCGNGTSPRDFVSTWVVLNGADNGSTGVCDAFTLLDQTAKNGGTTLKQAKRTDQLVSALTSIFQNIAAKASSGTAASILSNSEGSGANILQAVFYPKKIFDNQSSANWIGEMQNLWYFVDPLISHSTIREDTDGDMNLNLVADSVVSLRFDPTDNTTYAYVSRDTNGDGLGDTAETKEDTDLVKSVWRAGKQLWARDLTLSPRVIYTPKLTAGTEVNSTGLMTFTWGTIGSTSFSDNSTALAPYLQMADADSAVKLMKYVHGFDFPGDSLMRNRTVQIGSIPAATMSTDSTSLYVSNPRDKGIGVWKLGDIISSTPRIQSNMRLNGYGQPTPSGYSDASYNSFIGSNQYQSRGMVYVGANDGMLHAFKLGLLDVTASGYNKAKLTGTGLGEEQWAFIPKQALPYLKYASDPTYNHIYYVDGSTTLVDASIANNGAGCTTSYETCTRSPLVVDTSNNLDSRNTWRTVLVGGMGLGGASSSACSDGSDCVPTPRTDPATGSGGLGYSSYYALDITDPNNPTFLWEFNNPALGYATTGPAIVRVGEHTKNGRWFAVFGSGPTGPIDTSAHQFMGRSDQTLKFFVVDLATGTLVKTIDTNIPNAFAGSMIGGTIDADRWNPNVAGNYQDDAIYVGYTKKATGVGGGWTDGGVLRIVTNEVTDPNDAVKPWTWSTVIDGVGPVTSAISRLQDRKNRVLWLYFGSGRYFSRSGTTIDDYYSRRAIYGIKERCYNTAASPGNLLDRTCTASTSLSDLTDQSGSPAASVAAGWKVILDDYSDTYGAERVVTDAVALTNGTVFVTSFEPTADPCGFGGNSFLWALDYQSGGRPQDAALAGKALIQLSTGEFKEVDLSQAFGAGAARYMRRTSAAMTGKPPADAFPVISKSANKPVKRILHIQER